MTLEMKMKGEIKSDLSNLYKNSQSLGQKRVFNSVQSQMSDKQVEKLISEMRKGNIGEKCSLLTKNERNIVPAL